MCHQSTVAIVCDLGFDEKNKRGEWSWQQHGLWWWPKLNTLFTPIPQGEFTHGLPSLWPQRKGKTTHRGENIV